MAHTKRVKQHPNPKVPSDGQRVDGWENVATGLGVFGLDKRLGSSYCAKRLTQPEAAELWAGDDIIARAVELIPDEMLREGFCVQVAGDLERAEALDERHRELNTLEVVRTALYYARAFGGAGILLGADDGQDWSLPLNLDRIKTCEWLSAYTPQELQAVTYYSDIKRPRYGDIATYRLVPEATPPSGYPQLPIVHESRIVRLDGATTTRAQRLRGVHAGWDGSVLNRIVDVVRDFQAGWQGASIMLTDFSTPTLAIKGLARVLAGTPKDMQQLTARARALELCRSIARVAIVDADGESFKRETTTVTGLSDLLDKLCNRLAAAVGVPVSLLMGEAPAGLNATGDANTRWFYDHVKSLQGRFALPPLKRITTVMQRAKNGPTGGKELKNWCVKFPELWQLTELEQVQAHKTQAEADVLYITNQVVTPEEIAKSRFGGDEYSTRTEIDVELRDKMAAEADHQRERLDPEPVVDPNALPNALPENGTLPDKGKARK